jgi:endonuclease YncB( thermonuclease family)
MKYNTKCVIVHDGDTCVTRSNKWLRLAGVNCPELGKYGGQNAKAILARLIEGKTITYEPVGRSYARIIANVWVNGRSVNNYMRRLGYSLTIAFPLFLVWHRVYPSP